MRATPMVPLSLAMYKYFRFVVIESAIKNKSLCLANLVSDIFCSSLAIFPNGKNLMNGMTW